MRSVLHWLRAAHGVLTVVVAVIVSTEVISRQLTRTRLMPVLPGSPAALAAIPLGVLAVWLLLRYLTRREPPNTRPGRVTAGIFMSLFAAGLAMQLQLGARLQSDGFYYFAYLRSLVFDRDVNFMNDYRLLGLGDKRNLFEPTITGHAHSAWTIGPALVWAPFFGAGHMAATGLKARGYEIAVDGTSYPYRQAVCIAGLFYALLGAWCSIRAARQFFPTSIAQMSAALVVGGSFMLWYALAEPTMTHAPSMAAVAGFVWYWTATRQQRSTIHWVGLGLVAGLMTIIRWQNALFAVLPAIEAGVALWRAARARDAATTRAVVIGGLAFTVAATVACLPQMLAWKAIYGHYLAVSPVGPQIRWWDPHLVEVLFSSRNGLFATSPIVYVAALGLVLFARRTPAVGVPALVALSAMTYFNASIQDWWGSAGYGGRRFDGVVPLLVLGLAAALDAMRVIIATRPRVVAGLVLSITVVWNVTLWGASRHGAFTPGTVVSFRDVGAAQTRLLHEWIGHPASYPANLIYAWRNGVSPGAYDLLAALSFLGDPARPYGRVDIGNDDELFVLDGWHAPEREGNITFRWAGPSARVIVPLNFTENLDLQIRLRAFTALGLPKQMLTVDTGRATFGPFPVDADWQTIAIATPRSAWRAGVNRVELRFAVSGSPAGTGETDHRALAAAIDYVRVQIR